MSGKSVVLVGNRSLMNYVLACMTAIQGGAKVIPVKARGRAISRAVDVVQIVQRRFFTDLKIADITTGTEQLTREDNIPTNVSTIEIILNV